MHTPGFAAEASLYRSTHQYRAAAAVGRTEGIVPQLFTRGQSGPGGGGGCELRLECTVRCNPDFCWEDDCRYVLVCF